MTETRQIIVATGNRHKLAELRTVGSRFGLRLLSPVEAMEKYSLPPVPECDETGASFAENARLKARVFAEWSGRTSLGDDSGIEIDALEGMPGIYSARYAGQGASDAEKIQKLLRELEAALGKTPARGRKGRFRCALALQSPDGSVIEADGTLEGTVLREPRGENGFGYDPILLIDEFQKTLAEVDFRFTCENGFRARAAEKLFASLSTERLCS